MAKGESGAWAQSPRRLRAPAPAAESKFARVARPAKFSPCVLSHRLGLLPHERGLSELPSFTAIPGRAAAEHHGAGIVIAPSLASMERAFMDGQLSGWAQPIIKMLILSTLAPSGRHVASPASTLRRSARTGARGTRLARRRPTSSSTRSRPTRRASRRRSSCARSSRRWTSSPSSASSAATSSTAASALTSFIRQGPCSDTPTIVHPCLSGCLT
jgi:hypothetical protein